MTVIIAAANAVNSKDRIIRELNEADTYEKFVETAPRIVAAIDLTIGLWIELGYLYKAKEIAQRVVQEANRYLGMCMHYSRITVLERIKGQALDIIINNIQC